MQLYASYGARFEGRIVQQLIRSDGGTGLFRDSRLSMHDTWDTLLAVRSPSAGNNARSSDHRFHVLPPYKSIALCNK